MKLLNFETGAAQAPRCRKVRDRERRLGVLFDRFKAGNVSIDDHLESVEHHTGPVLFYSHIICVHFFYSVYMIVVVLNKDQFI